VRSRLGWNAPSLAVIDTGIGVPLHQQSAVFERFQQADSSISRRFGGTGLGLSISRRLVELMGGAIGLRSDGANGSEFWIELVLPSASRELSEEPAPRQSPSAQHPLRLLLAEDNRANQVLIAALLSPLGVALDVVGNGEQAVAAAEAGAYDLILMDMQMPIMDGTTSCRLIRSLPGEAGSVPIIALTANVMPEQIARCLAAGMQGHIAKPIDPEKLLQVVAASARRSVRPELA
jgi:CheY-like chemotaxis protein